MTFEILRLYGQRISDMLLPMLSTPLGLIVLALFAMGGLWLVSRIVLWHPLRTVLFLPPRPVSPLSGCSGFCSGGRCANSRRYFCSSSRSIG